MSKKNKFIFLVLLILIAFIGYRFLMKDDSGSSTSDLTTESSSSGQSSVGKELLATLAKIKSITLDEKIFSDPIFQNLNDFSKPMETQDIGRANPFAPIDSLGLSGDGSSSLGKKTKR